MVLAKYIKCLPRSVPGLLTCILLLGGHLTPASAATSSQQPRFQHLQISDGLSQATVNCVVQDPRGFVWFGTQDGLNRYDGHSCRIFKTITGDSTSLGNSFIHSLYVDHSGNLWIGTDQGLELFNRDSETFAHFVPADAMGAETARAIVVDITEGADNSLWLATRGRGLYRFEPATGTFTAYDHDPHDPGSLASGTVSQVVWSPAGFLWVGTAAGLQRLDPTTGVFAKCSPVEGATGSHPDLVVLSLLADWQGGVWAGTESSLEHFDQAGRPTRSFRHDDTDRYSVPPGGINSILLDREDRLWLGTVNSGLAWLERDAERFHRLQHHRLSPDSLADNRTLALYEDQAGVIWVGTYSHGVDRYDRFSALFSPSHSAPGLAGAETDYVRAFLVDDKGNTWVGTDGQGATRTDHLSGQTTHYLPNANQPGSLGSNRIFSFCQSRDKTIWLGADAGVLYRYLPEQDAFATVRLPLQPANSLQPNSIRAIHETGDGRLLVGTDGSGAMAYDPRSGQTSRVIAHGTAPEHLARGRVFAIVEDHLDNIWFAVFGSGLLEVDPRTGQQTHYHYRDGQDNGLGSSQVISIIEDRHGFIWVGTTNGLDKLEPGSGGFTHYRAEAGLPNNVIYAIVEDDDGYLWLSHNRGLTRFDPRTITCRNFDQSDGLQSDEFNGCASYKSADGELFFGGINGYNRFYPTDIRTNNFVPPVVITSLQLANHTVSPGPRADGTTVFSKAISESPRVVLQPRDNVVSFEFAALTYGAADKISYAYRLQGVDRDWNEVGNRRFATYSHLRPGHYEFAVKVANESGDWIGRSRALTVEVRPTIWETTWLRVLAGLALLLLVGGFYHYRTHLMRVRADLLQKMVRERTLALETEIAERQAAQEALAVAHRQAVQATEAKSTFLATMSHEIRTPMNGIMGMAQLLLESPVLSPEDREQATTIHTSGEALLTIINDILDFSKIEAGKMDLEAEPFDLHTAIAEVAELLAPKASGKGLELICLYGPDAPRHLIGDVGRIRQIILNLVGNGIKFTSDGQVTISVANEGEKVRIAVQDSGIGLSPAEQARLFQPFSQADSSTTRRFGGTGLGLAICKQLTELMGGEIGCEGEPGTGSTFWFTLSLPTAVSEPCPPSLPSVAGKRILIMDSFPVRAADISARIATRGARTNIVGTETQAVTELTAAAASADSYDLILLSSRSLPAPEDVLLSARRTQPAWAAVPVLLLLPAHLAIVADDLAAAGFAGALTKPVRPHCLQEAVSVLVADGTPDPQHEIFVTRRTLARLRAPELVKTAATVNTRPAEVWRVLLAEDNTVNQRVAKRMLEKGGCKVDLAANGEEAVQMWREFPYDLVFMDCRMPEMDGYEATAAIRSLETGTRHTPIIAMTANVMEGDKERCLEAGMDDYLPKPLRLDACHAAVARWTTEAAADEPELVDT